MEDIVHESLNGMTLSAESQIDRGRPAIVYKKPFSLNTHIELGPDFS